MSLPVVLVHKKGKSLSKTPFKTHQAGAPMERVHFDFVGPLPLTARGNRYTLVMVDQFTGSTTASRTNSGGYGDDFFSRFGYPFEISIDQGRNV
jgi:hypothetical protein